MNKKLNFIYIFFAVILMINISFPALVMAEEESEASTTAQAAADLTPSLDAYSAILIDANSGIILYEKNPHEKLYPASITKVMTTLLAVEYGGFDETLTHSHNAVFGIGYGSSHIGMDEGEQVNFKDGLYGIMLESANEVCMAVAEHIDGTVEAFVERMNEKAQEIGAVNTHYANPHGFHDDNHYTTAYDMSLIVKEAVKNDDFVEIFSTSDYNIPPTNKNVERYLHNKDKMVRPTSPYYYENIIGGKTGFTNEAGNTLISYASKNDIDLITVVMKNSSAANTYADTKALFEYGFSLYENRIILTTDTYSTPAKINQKYKDKIVPLEDLSLVPEFDIEAQIPYYISDNSLSLVPEINEEIFSPVRFGDVLGKVNVYYGDYILTSGNLIASRDEAGIDEGILEKEEKLENAKKIAILILKILAIIIIALVLIFIIIRIVLKVKKKRRRLKYKRNRLHKKNRSNKRRIRR